MATNLAKGAVGALGALAIAKTYFGPSKNDLSVTGRAFLHGSLSEIRSEALNTIGVARSTRGSMYMFPPGPMNYQASELSRIMAFYATDFNIPGAVVNTVDVRRYGVGVSNKYPVGVTLPEVTVTFIVDGQGLIQKFFYNWINTISNFSSRVNEDVAKFGNANLFDVGYKKDESGVPLNTTSAYLFINSENTSSVSTTDNAPAIIMYNFEGFYPISMSDVNMSWAASNGLATITVKFAYDYYSIQASDSLTPKPMSTALPQLSGLQQIVRGATLLQTITALKRPRNVNDIINVVNNTAMVASVVKKW